MHYYFFDTIESTMNTAFDIYRNEKMVPFSVVAKTQTNGRGRRGRKWISKSGNLFATFVIEIEKKYLSFLPFSVSLSVYNALRKFSVFSSQLSLKWPNDVLLNSQKIGGILLEIIDTRYDNNEQENAVIAVGIGLNTHTAPTNTPYPTTSLQENNIEIAHSNFLTTFEVEFLTHIKRLQNNEWVFIRKEWLSKCGHKNKIIHIKQHSESKENIFEGIFQTIDEQGHLVMEVIHCYKNPINNLQGHTNLYRPSSGLTIESENKNPSSHFNHKIIKTFATGDVFF